MRETARFHGFRCRLMVDVFPLADVNLCFDIFIACTPLCQNARLSGREVEVLEASAKIWLKKSYSFIIINVSTSNFRITQRLLLISLKVLLLHTYL